MQLGAAGTAVATALESLGIFEGVAGSVTLAALGALAVTRGNSNAVAVYKSAWESQRRHLDEDFQVVCSRELKNVHKRILDGVAPYTRYVETEQERVVSLMEDCEETAASAQVLRNRVNKLRHNTV